MSRIYNLLISSDNGNIELELEDTPTVRELLDVLPFESFVSTWGEESYFSTPATGVSVEDNAQQEVEPGTVCFWTGGNALALPWGRTPMSSGDKPCLVEPCNVLGKVKGDPKSLSKLTSGTSVRVELK